MEDIDNQILSRLSHALQWAKMRLYNEQMSNKGRKKGKKGCRKKRSIEVPPALYHGGLLLDTLYLASPTGSAESILSDNDSLSRFLNYDRLYMEGILRNGARYSGGSAWN